MMDDMLVEIDIASLKATRHFLLSRGLERGVAAPPPRTRSASVIQSHDLTGHGTDASQAPSGICSPTWAQPSVDGTSVFVACNASNELVEVDARNWTLTRRVPAAGGIYNLAVTTNHRLVTTNKRDQSVSVMQTSDLRELSRIRLKRPVVHGIVVSPDDRYAFVSEEGVGAEPGTVEMIDLRSFKVVANVDVAPQAGGIDFYKVE
jgi:DNA-binding beta-propeller fold protein YncE